jgi:hypothetical protein
MDLMSLLDHARTAVLAAGTHDLRIEQALEILGAYEGARATIPREYASVGDAARLPYPKETIQWSILLLLGAITDPVQREPLKAAYVSTAEWQALEDVEPAGFDSARLRRRIDPLSLAQELADRATPENRWLAASRGEQARLVEDLKRRGYW